MFPVEVALCMLCGNARCCRLKRLRICEGGPGDRDAGARKGVGAVRRPTEAKEACLIRH